MMKSRTLLLVACLAAVLCNGCAVVSSQRVRDKDHERHIVSVFFIPIWASTTPIDDR